MYEKINLSQVTYYLPLFRLVFETVIVGFHVFSNICK